MRILLTGAAGFIGSHVAEALLRRGSEVVGLDNFDPYYDPARKRRHLATASRHAAFRLVSGDIRDDRLLARLTGETAFDAVIHLAARAGVRPSIEDPAGYADVNVTGTARVLQAAASAGISRLVLASSSSVYGADSEPPFSTRARADRPVSPYAATKRAGELMAEAFATLHATSIVSLRYFTVYGPRQRPDMAIMKFIDLASAGRPVPMFGDGSSLRDFTYVDDAVAGTLAALDWTAGRRGHRAFNIGGGSMISLADLIDTIGRAMGKLVAIERLADQPGDVPLTYADVSESRDDLGWEPAVGVEEGIRRQVEWARAGA